MSVAIPIVAAVGAAVASLGWRAYRNRVQGGALRTHTSANGEVVETTLGRFEFDRAAGKIWMLRGEAPRAHINLAHVRGVQVRVGFTEAGLEELLLEGINLTDFSADYRDHRLHWSVVLTTSHGPVCVAVLSQYRKRDWFDFGTPVRLWILTRLGLYREGADAAAAIEHAVRRALRAAGLNVLGGYENARPTGALVGTPEAVDADLQVAAAPLAARKPLAIEVPEGAPDLWPSVASRDPGQP